jgi:DNA processing protein
MSVDDILEDLQTFFPKAPQLETSRPTDLTEDLQKVYEAISADSTPIDDIIDRSGLPAGAATAALLQLEMRRLVKQLPGKYFVKLL